MQTYSIVFFGTHTFAATVLKGLLESPFIDIEKVITQPDRKVGRKHEMHASPVKLLAKQHGILVEQPASLKQAKLESKADLFIVAQYGLLIPKHILDIPKHGVINVHTSLLPKYRGASPIQSSLINGEVTSGVTIMKMDVGMDTGPILLQRTLTIDPDDTYEVLDEKMAVIGTAALREAIPLFINGSLEPKEQDDSRATTCRQLSREDGVVDWSRTAQEIYNQYRGLTPWPGIWTTWEGRRIKLLAIRPSKNVLPPGLVSLAHDTIHIGTNDGSIEVTDIQVEGKRAMDNMTFINGFASIDGAVLDS